MMVLEKDVRRCRGGNRLQVFLLNPVALYHHSPQVHSFRNTLSPLRVADAKDAAVSGEGGQLGDLEFVYELIEAWVVGAVQL